MTPRHFVFVGLALGISWVAWLPQVVHALGWSDERPAAYLHFVGLCGPALAAMVVSARKGRLGELLGRCFTAKDGWIAAAIFGPFALFFLAMAILDKLGYAVNLEELGYSAEYPDLDRSAYYLLALVTYGLGGELGWRGYLLDRLQRRGTAVGASVSVAVFWAIWHLPLFVFEAGLSAMGPLGVLVWIGAIFGGSFLLTAMYNASGGSVFVVALFQGNLAVLINSPTGGPMRLAMGVMVATIGIALVCWPGFPWTRERE